MPHDLVTHYAAPRVVQSLRTKHATVARTRSLMLASKLEEHWSHMRLAYADLPGKHLLRQGLSKVALDVPQASTQTSMSLHDALQTYLTMKGATKGKTFHAAAQRACGYLVDACGLKHLHEYTRRDALTFRDSLIARGLAGSSITRVFNSFSSVFNFANSEHALDLRNPFVGVYHDRKAGVLKRNPIPVSDIKKVQALCRSKDDDARWLVALISDTGMRLSEAAGLLVSDLCLDAEVPSITIKANMYRRLKTTGSERVVPLVGASLWAAHRVVENADNGDGPAFPRYNKHGETSANSASAALNKWLKAYVPDRCTMHSFRHSMRDRLRAVNCPTEMIDQIGGWAHETVGQGYGQGYPIEQLSIFMGKACADG